MKMIRDSEMLLQDRRITPPPHRAQLFHADWSGFRAWGSRLPEFVPEKWLASRRYWTSFSFW